MFAEVDLNGVLLANSEALKDARDVKPRASLAVTQSCVLYLVCPLAESLAACEQSAVSQLSSSSLLYYERVDEQMTIGASFGGGGIDVTRPHASCGVHKLNCLLYDLGQKTDDDVQVNDVQTASGLAMHDGGCALPACHLGCPSD